MLEMRNKCERCSTGLAPAVDDAYICSYECTFCNDCAEKHLDFVCPNCGGKLVTRPARILTGTPGES